MGMDERRYTHPALQVTAHDMATTRPLEEIDDIEEDRYFWGQGRVLADPKGTYRLDLNGDQA